MTARKYQPGQDDGGQVASLAAGVNAGVSGAIAEYEEARARKTFEKLALLAGPDGKVSLADIAVVLDVFPAEDDQS
jgi:hypothetical protein